MELKVLVMWTESELVEFVGSQKQLWPRYLLGMSFHNIVINKDLLVITEGLIKM